ncbi:carboxymuconolactone decarboxylase family protein [Aeromicrobium ginsengisoli]|uniref:Carboxymuconolactone decarboxylase family protein n=1 Tax=Aeromicrobium ginsengisoli TaxID=363867 RepID=A0A5M4FBV7_9ACTN|nr:carboxymuconolactone decarboxylase family protein [Aeromicrobium ginsengisoli]KAA1395785.1 carboxymuconolactone decarboxylase family protein [Aeromicrobium ginsengisoli]
MPRIPALAPEDAGPIVKIGYRMARKQVGEVPEPFAIMAHHRKIFMLAARHELALQKAMHVVPAPLIELAVYRTAWTVGCSWCVDFGAMLQRLEGLNIDRLKEIGEFETSDKFTDDEREVIRYSDAITATPTEVTDEQVAALVEKYGHDGVLELTYQITHENQRARMNHALGITDQGFSSGDACRVPWATDLAEPASQAV